MICQTFRDNPSKPDFRSFPTPMLRAMDGTLTTQASKWICLNRPVHGRLVQSLLTPSLDTAGLMVGTNAPKGRVCCLTSWMHN